ncbi:MAG: hypothetical protein H0W57_06070 [Rubrobacteraceae bacterium]|nr:hypothetical protein [Rubrobacter sp.]MBA3635970.1 hypothetical protein [Rubrobacteraceae bacterium]
MSKVSVTDKGRMHYSLRGGEIEPLGRGLYSVPGSEGTYTVDLAVFGGQESCNCPARTSCYHLIAATMYRAKTTAARRRSSRPKVSPEDVEAKLARMGA